MSCSQEARERWLTEKPVYKSIGDETHAFISDELKRRGISPLITSRVKDIDSLIKKTVRKGKNYDDIHDKVGIRIVVCFKEQINALDTIIKEIFIKELVKREDKAAEQGEDVFGYQSIHYDICKCIEGKEYFCEIQLRTICQNNWSELSHALSYKSEIDIPKEINREINALSAIFEVADNQFQLINSLINKLPETNPIRILNYLERFFYTYIGDTFDSKLSWYFLKNIQVAYSNTDIIVSIENFVRTNETKLLEVIKKNKNNLFFTQPEIIVILDRITNCKYGFVQYWQLLFPIDELEEIANAWGTSLE